MSPKIAEYSNIAGRIGLGISIMNFNNSFKSGDLSSIAYSGIKLGVSYASLSNPTLGLSSAYLDMTYIPAIKKSAEFGASVNTSYNNDPVQFMSKFYDFAGTTMPNWKGR